MNNTQIEEQIRHLDFDALGDEMKRYEKKYHSEHLMPGLPTVIRFDGNAFHTFTKGIGKPYDVDLAQTFQCTVDDLIKELNPDLAYHQSDEISLFWLNEDPNAQLNFDGKVQKWLSIYAAKCSVIFNSFLQGFMPRKFAERPVFDARVFQFPKWDKAYDYFVWRQWDARKNSVSMAAHTHFGTKELFKKNTAEKIEMLRQVGINFQEDYPESFKQGTFTRKMYKQIEIDDNTWSLIPDQHKPADRKVWRNSIQVVQDVPKLTAVTKSEGAQKIFHEVQ